MKEEYNHENGHSTSNNQYMTDKLPYILIGVLVSLLIALLSYLFLTPADNKESTSSARNQPTESAYYSSEPMPDRKPATETENPEILTEPKTDYAEATASTPTTDLGGQYRMTGLIDGEYPITARFVISPQGHLSGAYAYELTLSKYGDKSSSWIKIGGWLNGMECSISQNCPGVTEPWPDIDGSFRFVDGRLQYEGQWHHNGYHSIYLYE